MTKKARRALIIFVRNPEKGKVKTRLAKTLGEDKALAIYEALLAKTRTVAEGVDALRLLFYSVRVREDDRWPGSKFKKLQQQGADLGERMEQAFEVALQQAESAIIVGSDIAQIDTTIIEEAFETLRHHDYVLGPAVDGGYYLLGMKKTSPYLFRDMTWSTGEVGQITQDRIHAQGGSLGFAPALSDIDYAEDWEKFGWEV
ncbi:MAG: TIGR04282 family arsenosugar biosynthesis glycosyltransferase [Phaeodactylibacter sp.]|uniref:TIGR04282 family arsenosugar biosynthesis glycosyltransferase n=1 Tax=Phaeodactylibacter sp. TaxID=1940289 RepID=UPI0032EA9D69